MVQGLTCCPPGEAKLFHFHWGMSLEQNKDLKGAIVQYRKAVELDPGYR